ncbi:uncharacterized protein TNCV_3247611 [Trichonephila clavipes]|nr:uncharacterized protein TNCV_3247611 [Trichonephila clavipes]
MNVLQSLENMALIKVAICVYHSSDFSEVQEKFRSPYGFLDLMKAKELFGETISNFVLPIRLREKLLDIIQPIIMDIETWNMQKKKFGVRKQLDICLTSSGTIDRIETAKKYVRSKDQNVVKRFALACHFWLTDDVLKIWNKANVDERIHMEMELLHPENSSYWRLERLRPRTGEQFQVLETIKCLKQWFDWLHGGGDPCTQRKFLDEHLFTFSHTIPEPNLLQALPPDKLRQLIKRKYRELSGRFYFSCLDYSQKLSLLQQEPFMILNDYLKWPLQFKFLEMAGQAWKYMTGNDFYGLLWIISRQIMSTGTHFVEFDSGFDYEILFLEFWKQSPYHLKISAKEHHNYHRYPTAFGSMILQKGITG